MSRAVHIVKYSRQNISGENGAENEREDQEVGTGQRRKEKKNYGRGDGRRKTKNN